ncbi:uncharacterized protein N7500_005174 [Penicillium coprophilum]|uniref:uncharacterized protein n=1 Tax=Penicillium coprophilum TaxID=36646 RepID=UPI002394E402|nr:uncharacterized protein N7500_005174 [Penicillium coprophilum]KAJ5163344.1 hypothetical protein N7500_005174 [Penicillium coprophilum]
MNASINLRLKVQDTRMARNLEEQDQNMNYLPLEESKWIESSINPQHMVNDFGPSWDSIRSQHDDMPEDCQEQNAQLVMLKEFREQNARLRHAMKEQEKVILHLTKHHEDVAGQLEQDTARMICKLKDQAKKIADLESEKGWLVRDLREQTRIASTLEKRDTKMKKVLGDTASIMFLELEYQEELINEMPPNDWEYFQPTHEALMDLVENIEHWTADDENSDMMFNLEDESNVDQLYAELLSGFDEQSCQLKIQAIKLDRQKSIIDEQTSIISELGAQKQKMAGNLEEKNVKLALILEYLQETGEDAPLISSAGYWYIDQSSMSSVK